MVSSNAILDAAYLEDLQAAVGENADGDARSVRFERSGLARFNTQRRYRRSGSTSFGGSHRRSEKKKRF